MNVSLASGFEKNDDRPVGYKELVITGDTHTLSVRQYSRNTNIVMYNNVDRKRTKVLHKYPNTVFSFRTSLRTMLSVFSVQLPTHKIDELASRWYDFISDSSF